MTTTDYAQTILEVKKEVPSSQSVDEAAAYSATQLISGSSTLTLYGGLWKNFFDMDGVTEHLEAISPCLSSLPDECEGFACADFVCGYYRGLVGV